MERAPVLAPLASPRLAHARDFAPQLGFDPVLFEALLLGGAGRAVGAFAASKGGDAWVWLEIPLPPRMTAGFVLFT